VKLLLFDIDQTLVNTGGAGLRALNRACEHIFGLNNAMEDVSPHGKTDPAIAREILRKRLGVQAAAHQISSVLDGYLSFLQEEVQSSPNYRILPGILPLLEELQDHDKVILGLATGNIEAGARIKLARADLNRYFAFGGFGSDSEDRTELVRKAAAKASHKNGAALSPANVFVIGDTPLDIDAGKRAGFNTIGVGTGSYSKVQLLDAGATMAVNDLAEGRDQFLRSIFIE
jgi:phosphoglycolate phosphatase